MQYHEAQEWYWLENQTPQEPFMFLTWDSESNGQARCKSTLPRSLQMRAVLDKLSWKLTNRATWPDCPHLSFKNEYAGANAPPRESVETRSIVITRRGANG